MQKHSQRRIFLSKYIIKSINQRYEKVMGDSNSHINPSHVPYHEWLTVQCWLYPSLPPLLHQAVIMWSVVCTVTMASSRTRKDAKSANVHSKKVRRPLKSETPKNSETLKKVRPPKKGATPKRMRSSKR